MSLSWASREKRSNEACDEVAESLDSAAGRQTWA